MIYVKRLLWVIFYFPMVLIITFAFLIGFLAFPFIVGLYYIKDGTISSCKIDPDTLAIMVDRFFQRFRPK